MFKLKKVFVVLLAIIILILAFRLIAPNLNSTSTNKESQDQEVLEAANSASDLDSINIGQADFIRLIAVKDDTSALDLLMNHHLLELQEYDFGIFVQGINGLSGDQDHFWAIYINDEQSLVGIQDIVLNRGEAIEFRYEAINQ